MLEKSFERLYLMFRSNYYKRVLKEIGISEGSLSATESFCVEIIYLLDRPTVSEFAAYLNLSIPNANYKINSLVKKGYVIREQSTEDLREQHLCVTEKFLGFYGLKDTSIARLMRQIRSHFTPEEIDTLDAMIQRVNDLMQIQEG